MGNSQSQPHESIVPIDLKRTASFYYIDSLSKRTKIITSAGECAAVDPRLFQPPLSYEPRIYQPNGQVHELRARPPPDIHHYDCDGCHDPPDFGEEAQGGDDGPQEGDQVCTSLHFFF